MSLPSASPAAVRVEPAQRPSNPDVPPTSGESRGPQPGWPLVVCFAGLPLWWVLGLIQVVFFLASVAMLVYLARSRDVRTPRGLGIWLLFLVWLLGGLFTMQITAPSTIPGQSLGRYAVFAYRGLWYVMGMIAMLYVLNTRGILSAQRICMAISWMFVTLVGGGLLGVFAPTLEFTSAFEWLLPGFISNNGFVNGMVHGQVAQIQDFLGYIEPRPSAPFAYSNEWGLNLVCTLPFFVVAWWRQGGLYRILMPLVLLAAMSPIVSSLNRGLWGALLILAVYVAVRSLLHGRAAVLLTLTVGLGLVAAVIVISPLGDLLQDRINTPHSNQGRANLSSLSVESTLGGSPVIGFGTTRDVEGNFNSIAGGETDRCPACSPPPLGTQGQLWLVLFGSGVVGLVLYCAFFVSQFLRHVRSRSPYSLAAQCTLIALLVTMPVYNAAGPAILVALVAVGIMAREGAPRSQRPFGDLLDPARRNLALILGLALVGTAAGATVQRAMGSTAIATQTVVVPADNIFGVPGTRPLTLDSEARLVLSDRVLRDVADVTESPWAEVVESMSITAEPNSKILKISYRDADSALARKAAQQAADSYVAYRQELVRPIRQSSTERLESQQATLASYYNLVAQTLRGAEDPINPQLAETSLQLRFASRDGFSQLSSLRESSEDFGQTLGDVQIRQPWDPWLLRLGSGFMLGLLAGLILVWYTDGRWNRLGTHPERRLGIDIPTVAHVSATGLPGQTPGAPLDATRAVRSYLPLCGVVSDTQPAAQELASHLRPALAGPNDNAGNRVILVVAETSTPRSVRRMHRMCLVAGQQPVGLILASPAQPSP